jgi:hypothetical protein
VVAEPEAVYDFNNVWTRSPWVLDCGEGSASDAGRRARDVIVAEARRSRGIQSLQATRAHDGGQHAARVTTDAAPVNWILTK